MKECKNVETWITLPKNRRPKSWDKYDEPVCLLKRNLYGHPLAGLFWEKHAHKAIVSEGFEKCKGWECLYVHKKQQLFLSIYVDDFKMAGNQGNLVNQVTIHQPGSSNNQEMDNSWECFNELLKHV